MLDHIERLLSEIRRLLTPAVAPPLPRRQLLFESLEPRLLLSADFSAGAAMETAAIYASDERALAVITDENAVGPPANSAGAFPNPALTIDWVKTPTACVALPLPAANAQTTSPSDPPLADYLGAESALRSGLAQLEQFGDKFDEFGGLAQQLPLLHGKIGDLIDVGGILKAKIVDPVLHYLDNPGAFPTAGEASGVANTDGIVAALRASINTFDAAATIAGGLAQSGDKLVFDISFRSSKTTASSVDFNASLGGLGLALDAAVNVDLTTRLDLDFEIGIDLSGPAITGESFFIRVQDLSAHADVAANDLHVGASVGVIDASIVAGSVALTATIAAQFSDDTITLSELIGSPLADLATLTSTGTLAATLPVEVSLAGFTPTGSPRIEIADDDLFTDPGPTAALQHFDQLFDVDQLFGGFSTVDGLDQLLGALQGGLDSGVFSKSLPLVGCKLKDAAQLISTIRGEDRNANGSLDAGEDFNGNSQLDPGLVDRLRLLHGNGLAPIQEAVFAALGPAGLDLLALDKDLHDAGQDSVPDTAPDFNDVESLVSTDRLAFVLRLHQDLIASATKIDFDMGLPLLQLDVQGDVEVRLGFDLVLGFGVHRVDDSVEFFIDTLAKDTSGAATPELTVSFEVAVPDLQATGQLGFLRLSAHDEDADSDPDNNWDSPNATATSVDVDNDGVLPTRFTGSFTIDLTSPDANGRVGVSEIGLLGIDATLDANADVNLVLTVDFGSADFPSFSTDFALDWDFSNAETSGTDPLQFGARPQLSFNNARMNLGGFVSRFVGPLVDHIRQVLEPLRPINLFISQRIPVLSDFSVLRGALDDDGDGKVTLLDLAKKAKTVLGMSINTEIFDAIGTLLDLSNKISMSASGIQIPIDLGSRSVGQSFDVRSTTGKLADAPLTGNAPPSKEEQVTDRDALDIFQRLSAIGISIAPFNGANGALDPSTIFDLLLGKEDVTLLTWNPPPAVLGSKDADIFRIDVPIFPGFLTASIGGKLYLTADFAFGYDTAGLVAFGKTQFDPAKLSLLADGFYVADVDPATHQDIAELCLTGSIVAAADVGIGPLFKAGVEGDVTATIGFNLHDIDPDGAGPEAPDGKIRWRELAKRIAIGDAFGVGPLAVFDLNGSVSAGLSAFVWTGLKIPFDGKFTLYEARKELFRGTLLDYNLAFPDEIPPAAEPALASLRGTTLTLSMTSADDNFTISHADGNANDAAGESVYVRARNRSERFDGVKLVIANASDGRDVVIVEDDVSSAVRLSGGSGDDVLRAGSGNAVLDGGDGRDQLVGSAGDDLIADSGQATNAWFDDKAGVFRSDADDVLFGGSGTDTLDGGAGSDWIEGGSGNDLLSDTGRVAHTHQIADPTSGDIESITDADDVLFGDSSDPDTSDPGGNDVLRGGAGRDHLNGNPGDDILHGGADVDVLVGEDGNDTLTGDAGDDAIDGSAGNDRYQFSNNWGSDRLTDADGEDTFDFSAASQSLAVTLHGNEIAVVSASDAIAAADSASPPIIEHLVTGSGSDSFAIGTERTSPLVIDAGPGNDIAFGPSVGSRWDVHGANAFVVDNVLPLAHTENIGAGGGNDAFILLPGGSLDGRIDGGPGADTLDYGDYLMNVAVDLRLGTATNVGAGVVHIENVMGGAGADTLRGDDTHNHLRGRTGSDILEGRGGDDLLDGGSGDDRYVFSGMNLGQDQLVESDDPALNDAGDTLDFSAFGSGVQIFLALDATGPAQTINPMNLSLSLSSGDGFENVVGANSFGNYLEGNVRDNTLQGGLHDDLLFGHTGNDTYVFIQDWGTDGVFEDPGEGSDTFDFSNVASPLTAHIAADNMSVTDGVNLVIPWDDPMQNLIAGRGNDTVSFVDTSAITGNLDGGPGIDTLDYSSYGVAAVVDLNHHNATGVGGFVVAVENVFGSDGADDLMGDGGPNVLVGRGGNDHIIGQGDDDVINGEAGDDILLGGAGNDTIVGGPGDDRILGADGNDDLRGDAGNDELQGGLAADLLQGGAGDDQLFGGDGDDRYVFSGVGLDHDGVIEAGGIGGDPPNDLHDTLDFSNFGAAVWVDLGSLTRQTVSAGNLDLTLSDPDVIEDVIGSALGDFIKGNSRNNVLEGAQGDDGLFGLAGDDRYVFAGGHLGSDVVVEAQFLDAENDPHDSLDFGTFAAGVQIDLADQRAQTISKDHLKLTLQGPTGIEDVVGSRFDDTITGNIRDNGYAFRDNWGRDSVRESAGQGNDTLDLSQVTSPVVVQVTEMSVTSGVNLIASTLDRIENVVGGRSDDRFDFGVAGSSTGFLDGGGGNDTLNFAAYRTAVSVDLASGTATGVQRGVNNVENIVGSVSADVLSGNDAANRIASNGGADSIVAGAGDDVIRVDSSFAQVAGGQGQDTLQFTGTTLDIATRAGTTLQSVERVDVTGAGINQIVVSGASVATLASPLLIVADDKDAVIDVSGAVVGSDPSTWKVAANSPEPIDGRSFAVFEHATRDDATLKINQCLPGDFDCDGDVDKADLTTLSNAIQNKVSDLNFDLNGDGKVNAADARKIATLFTVPARSQ